MQKIFTILGFTLVCFFIQNIVSQFFGGWVRLDLLVILIVFFNLYRGLRYSLLAAFFAGLLMDSFSANLFGLNIFSLMSCAYLTTLFKRYIYQMGSVSSRVLIVFLGTLINVVIHYIVNLMSASIDFSQAFMYVFIPEIITTTLLAHYCFEKLKQCALRLFA